MDKQVEKDYYRDIEIGLDSNSNNKYYTMCIGCEKYFLQHINNNNNKCKICINPNLLEQINFESCLLQ